MQAPGQQVGQVVGWMSWARLALLLQVKTLGGSVSMPSVPSACRSSESRDLVKPALMCKELDLDKANGTQ